MANERKNEGSDRQRRLLVIGSLNLDYICRVAQLPKAGQTYLASNFVVHFGGKGANQAIAAARQGARVDLIGRVGTDAEGEQYRGRLRAEKVDIRRVRFCRGDPTGRAFIVVDDSGENSIVVASGANARLTRRDVRSIDWRQYSLVLMQLEVPLEVVESVMELAQRARVPLMLNAAPLHRQFRWGRWALDYLVVNEHEAAELFGRRVPPSLSRWERIARPLMQRWRIGALIVTRGKRSTYVVSREGRESVATIPVRPRDTVGAGDAFVGTLAARLVRKDSLRQAVAWANCAGALATQKLGAQESLPRQKQTRDLVRRMRLVVRVGGGARASVKQKAGRKSAN